MHPLDNPAWSALTSTDQHLAVGGGSARRYRPDVAAFAGIQTQDDAAWANLAKLETPVAVINSPVPAGWSTLRSLVGYQMVGPDAVTVLEGPAIQPLAEADIPDMLELVQLTQPGPFSERTIDLGGYVGIKDAGRLVAMAGERMHPLGFTEISAVCTHPEFRGKGLAAALMLQVASGILARGDKPFLHVLAANTGAVRLYENLGFSIRTDAVIAVVAPPAR